MYVNEKMRPAETIPEIKRGEIKDDGGSEFNSDIL
jgi:hypothetical protein